ncbi:hypothetical protein RJ641_004828, partial [Dillenia turbinata]
SKHMPHISLLHMPDISLQCLAKKVWPHILLITWRSPNNRCSTKIAKEVMKIHDLALSSRPQIFSAKHLEEEVARLVHRKSYLNTTNLTKMLGIGCSVRGDYDRQGFRKILDDIQGLLGGFSIEEFFPSMEFIHSLTGMKLRLQVLELLEEIIKEHLNQEKEKGEHKDFVDVLLDIHKNKGEIPFTMDNVKGIML